MSGEGKTGANRQKKYVESNPDKAQLSQLKKYNNITQKRLEDPDYDKDCREMAKLRKQRQRDKLKQNKENESMEYVEDQTENVLNTGFNEGSQSSQVSSPIKNALIDPNCSFFEPQQPTSRQKVMGGKI